MKLKATLRSFLLLACSSLLAISYSHAATLTWDANGATALQTDGAGAWDTALQLKWWTGSTNVDWTSGESAIFGNGGAGGAVTLASITTLGSLTFNYFTGTYTLGTAGVGNTITLNNGITKNAGSGAVTIVSPITLGGSQTWMNNSTNKVQISSFVTTSLGQTLTLAGTGEVNFPTGTTGITGDGSIIVDGVYLNLISGGNQAANSYTGTTTVTNGGAILYYQSPANIGTGNINLNGGTLEGYFNQGFTRPFGTASGQFQITGGVSGFGVNGSNTINFSNVTEVQWGSASFNPSKFVLGGGRNGGTTTFAEGIDLNGADRTVTSNVGGVLSAVVRTDTGTAGLIKEGPGALSLTAANTYNGATTITGGTLTLSGSGTANSSTALNLGGGTLRLVNTAQLDRFADVAVTVSAGGGISYENTNTAAITYTETLGAVTVSGGLLNVVQNTNQSTSNGQTLTFGTSGSTNLTQSGTGSVAFSALTTGPQATGNKNMFVVFGSGTTAAGQIIGPWATVGTAANAQTDYAAYNADYVVPAAIAGSAETTWLVAADPYTMDFSSAGATLTGTRNVGALRIIGGTPLTSVDFGTDTITLTGHTFVDGNTVVFGTGAPAGLTAGTTYFVVSAAVDTFKVSATNGGAAINLTSAGTSPTVIPASANTLALSTGNNLGTNGILNGSPYAISITPGTGGSVTLPTTSAGNLYINAGSGGITIDAPITNNTGALTLVKNGSGTLLLRAANNAYTGDTIINAGTLQIGNGNPGTTGTLNGGAYAGNIFIAGGATLNHFLIGTQTFSGIISGDGNLVVGYTNLTLGTSNTYTGRTSLIPQRAGGGGQLNVASFNSVFTDAVLGTTRSASSSLGAPTTIANGTIQVGNGSAQSGVTLKYTGSGEVTDRVINFQPNNASVTLTLDTSGSGGSGLLKFTSAPVNTGSTAGNLLLQGSTNGEFVQGLPFVFANFTKNGNGTWTLGGAVGNSGTTTVSAGTLVFNASQASPSGAFAVNGTSTLAGTGRISGAVTVAAGANLTPGSSGVGTLTFGSTLNISALAGAVNAGLLNYDLGPIASSDKIVVAGNLNIGTDLLRLSDFNFTPGALQNGTYKLITSGGITGSLDTITPGVLTGTVGGGTGTLQITGNDIELVISGLAGGITFADWKTTNGAGLQTLADDHDGDGVDNGTEYFLFGNGNSTGFTALPGITNTLGTLSVTWVKAGSYAGIYGTDFVVETSATLAAPWTAAVLGGSPDQVVISGNNVTYTFPAGTKNFARLKVTGP